MPIYQYGTQNALPDGYTPVRDILATMGYKPENIGYNPQNKNPILMGNELDATKMILGSDQRYYATSDIINPMLSNLGLSTNMNAGMGTGYQSPYAANMNDVLNKILNRPAYSFDPNTDAGFQQASKDIQNAVMLDFAKRNMLYSPATGEAVSKGIAQAYPQFEQAAYGRYQDEGTYMFNMLNALMGIDQQTYGMYRDAIDNRYREWEKTRTEKLDALDAQYKKIDYAYKKLDEMEFADDEIASILGVPVGTKSQTAKARAEDQKNKLEIMQEQAKQDAIAAERDLANQKALIQYRDAIDKANAAQQKTETEGTPDQQAHFQAFMNLYNTDPNFKDNPTAALQNVLARRWQHEQLLGTPLYNKLVDTLTTMASASPKTSPKNFNLSEVDSTVTRMQQNGSDAQTIGTFIVKSLLNAGYDEDAVMSQLNSYGYSYDDQTGAFSEL